MNNPFFTVITATFNSEKTLRQTLESLLHQTYTHFEYLIIDGASTDTTVEIIKSYESKFVAKNISFRWISEPDTGIYNAWNKGVKLAQGDFISFLGSDDIYYPDALENYAKAINNAPKDLEFISSKIKYVKNGEIISTFCKPYQWNKMRYMSSIGHPGSFHSKSLFKKYGYYDEAYRIVADTELLLRAKNNLITAFLDCFTVEMAAGGVSSNIKKTYQESYEICLKTGKSNPVLLYCVKQLKLQKALYFNKRICKT